MFMNYGLLDYDSPRYELNMNDSLKETKPTSNSMFTTNNYFPLFAP